MKTIIIFLAALGLSLAASAQADRRAFTRTYEYVTQAEDALELEYYLTQQQTDIQQASTRSIEQQVEIEYGLTNRWDISIYQVYSQPSGGALSYSATKLRTRYRFSERGINPVDVLAYFELIRPYAGSSWKLEPKLVLAKDVGKVTLAVNLIPEFVFTQASGPDGGTTETEFEPGWALGVTYEASPKWKLGGETWGAMEEPFDSEARTTELYAGPAVSFAP
ncbi:MAG: hypothetical protein IPL79_05930 [Myxococcales bacterium]|nr:hypothetical protein [Myxococcales bacterium]